MALGLTLADDLVDVYVLDRRLESRGGEVLDLELMRDSGVRLYSNRRDEPLAEYLPTDEIARRLLEYDHILPY